MASSVIFVADDESQVFEQPPDNKHRNRVKWLLSKWDIAPAEKEGSEVSGKQEAAWSRGAAVEMVGGEEKELEEREGDREERGDKERVLEGDGEVKEDCKEGGGGEEKGGQGKKGKYRRVLDWGTMKYKQYRYKYDPRKFCKITISATK